MVFQPQFDSPWFQNASISVDYYNVRLKNAIAAIPINLVVSSCFNLNGQNPSYSAANPNCALLNRSPATGFLANSLAPYENLGQIKTGGVDLEADWLTDFDDAMGWSDAGTMGVNMVGTYLNDFKLQAAPGGNFTEFGGTDFTGLYGPYATWRFNSTFTYHNWGGISACAGALSAPCRIAPWRPVRPAPRCAGAASAQLFRPDDGYTLTDTQTRLSLTVSNVLDTTPPTLAPFRHTIQGLYSPLGRIYLLSLDQRF